MMTGQPKGVDFMAKQFETLHVGDILIYNSLRTLEVTAIKGDEATTRCKETGVLQVHSVAHIKHCTLYKHTRYSLDSQIPGLLPQQETTEING